MSSVCFHGFLNGCVGLHPVTAIYVKDVAAWLVPRAFWALLTATPDYTSLAASIDGSVGLRSILPRLCEANDKSIAIKALDAVYDALPHVLTDAFTVSFSNSMGSVKPFAGLEMRICRDDFCWLKVVVREDGSLEVSEVSRLTKKARIDVSCRLVEDKAAVAITIDGSKYEVELSYKPLDEVEVAAWAIVTAVKALPNAVLGWPGLATDVLYVPAGRASIAALTPLILGHSMLSQVPLLTLAPNPERSFAALLLRAGVHVPPEHSQHVALLRDIIGYDFNIDGIPHAQRQGSKTKFVISNAPRGVTEAVTIAKLLSLPSKPPMVIVEEPGEGLPDDKAAEAIKVLVEGLKGDVQKLMLVTSNVAIAKLLSRLADKLYVVEDGVVKG